MRTSLACTVPAVAFAIVGPAASAAYNTQLVVNGGAETGDTSGWVSSGIDAVPATGSAVGFGEFTFTGGLGSADGQGLDQAIDVSEHASDIDAGLVASSFMVYIQSREAGGIDDIGSVTVSFRDVGGGVLGSASFVDPPEINPIWQLYTDERTVPTGTRLVTIELFCTREGGASTDAFFDEVSLVFEGPAPCPEDLSGDGTINSTDLNILLADFGCAGGGCGGDIDGDGDTDSADLNLLLAAFGQACG